MFDCFFRVLCNTLPQFVLKAELPVCCNKSLCSGLLIKFMGIFQIRRARIIGNIGLRSIVPEDFVVGSFSMPILYGPFFGSFAVICI